MLPIIFDHVRKTGGTSIFQVLADIFGVDKISPKLACKLSHATALYKNKQVISGHFDISPTDKLPTDRVSLTFVRNPTERTISEIYFIKHDVPPGQLSALELRVTELTLDEAVFDPEITAWLGNYQSKHFASFFHPRPHLLSEFELLEMAKRGLDQFSLVGITENIPEFIEELHRIFSFDQPNQLIHINKTTKRARLADLLQETQRRIEAINRVDFELWHYAQRLFNEKTKFFNLPISTYNLAVKVPKDEKTANDLVLSSIVEGGQLELLSVIVSSRFRAGCNLLAGEDADLTIKFRCHKSLDDLTIGYSLHHDSGLILFGINTRLMGYKINCSAGNDYQITFTFPMLLGIGTYTVDASAHKGFDYSNYCYFIKQQAATFQVENFLGIQFEGLVSLVPTTHFDDCLNYEDTLNHSFGFKRIGFAPLGTISGKIRALTTIPCVRPREQFSVPVEITNSGSETWYCEGTQQVNIAYHWYDMDGNTVLFDGARTPLPIRALNPGITVRGSALVEAPRIPGRFSLELTLVQEQVFWFEDRGFVMEKCEVDVKVD